MIFTLKEIEKEKEGIPKKKKNRKMKRTKNVLKVILTMLYKSMEPSCTS